MSKPVSGSHDFVRERYRLLRRFVPPEMADRFEYWKEFSYSNIDWPVAGFKFLHGQGKIYLDWKGNFYRKKKSRGSMAVFEAIDMEVALRRYRLKWGETKRSRAKRRREVYSMKAKRDGVYPYCHRKITGGRSVIAKGDIGWGHRACVLETQ